MMPSFVDKSFPQNFLRKLWECRNVHVLCDCVIRIESQQSGKNPDSESLMEEIYAHRLVLAATSNFFRELFLLKKDQKDAMTIVNLKLHSPNAVKCFKIILDFLYSGQLHMNDCDPKDVYHVAKVCQIVALEDYLSPFGQTNVAKQPPSSPIDSKPANSDRQDHGPTPPARVNLFSTDQNINSDGSVAAAFLQSMMAANGSRSMAHFSPVSSAKAYVPVQSTVVSMALNPHTATLPTITAAEMRSNLIHQGYYGPLLPTTTSLLPPTPHSAPPYPTGIPQGFPFFRMPVNGPPPTMQMSASNGLTNGHGTGSAEGGGSSGGASGGSESTPRKMMMKRAMNAKPTQRPLPPDAPYDNLGDVIIPSSEKEGWCRNKKYIERVPNGFMCTVCRKVYGRYNSVSYHVTIYHRNPPIKCDEPGCQFTTREARYIHFHKYYRHHIALPESIDLGSRKCPFCRHVSKSPAMLEKHINRHLPDCNRVGRMFQCPQCPKQLGTQKAMCDHILTHSEEKNYPCEQCNYKGKTESSLTQHVLFKHSSLMFKQKMCCKIDDCNFTSASIEAMHKHQLRVHGKVKDTIDNADLLLDQSNHEEDDDSVMDSAVMYEDEEELIDVECESTTASMASDPIAPVTPPPQSPKNYLTVQ